MRPLEILVCWYKIFLTDSQKLVQRRPQYLGAYQKIEKENVKENMTKNLLVELGLEELPA